MCSVRSRESHVPVTARLTDSGSGHVAELSPGVGEGLLPSPTPAAPRQQGDQDLRPVWPRPPLPTGPGPPKCILLWSFAGSEPRWAVFPETTIPGTEGSHCVSGPGGGRPRKGELPSYGQWPHPRNVLESRPDWRVAVLRGL